jgi:hypothetical protein
MSNVERTDTPGAGATCSGTCHRHAARGPLLAAVGWLAAALAALSVSAVPFEIGESFCGVWGCFPPLPALAAMHLFWCVVFGAGVHALGGWRPVLLRPVGVVLVFAATAATVLIVGPELYRWLGLPEPYRSFWARRVGYILATKTDAPLLQSLAAGIACLVLSRRRRVGQHAGPQAAAFTQEDRS